MEYYIVVKNNVRSLGNYLYVLMWEDMYVYFKWKKEG